MNNSENRTNADLNGTPFNFLYSTLCLAIGVPVAYNILSWRNRRCPNLFESNIIYDWNS